MSSFPRSLNRTNTARKISVFLVGGSFRQGPISGWGEFASSRTVLTANQLGGVLTKHRGIPKVLRQQCVRPDGVLDANKNFSKGESKKIGEKKRGGPICIKKRELFDRTFPRRGIKRN